MNDNIKALLAKLTPMQRERTETSLAKAEGAGNAKCADCGLITGVFRINLCNVRGSDGKAKQVCQICKSKYEGVKA